MRRLSIEDWMAVPCTYCDHDKPGLPCTLYGAKGGRERQTPHIVRQMAAVKRLKGRIGG